MGSSDKKKSPGAQPAKPGSSSAANKAGPAIQLSPKEIWLCIKERAWAAGIIAIVACVLLGGWLFSQPKVYQAQSRLLLDRKERVLDMAQVVDQTIGGGKNDAMFDTFLEQIISPDMISRVVASLNEKEKLAVWRPYADENATVPDKLDPAVRRIVAGNVGASRQGNTFFIIIKVKHREPVSAALLASRFAIQFIGYQLERNNSVNNSALVFLREQTEALRLKADESERALQKYRESTGMVSLDESRNIVVDRMKSLSSTVTGARVSRLAIEARLRQAEAILAGSGDPLELATTAEFASLANVQSQLDDLRTKRAIMAERYGVRHPSMIDNQRSREALEKLRAEMIIVAMANLRNQQAKSASEERQLQAQLADAEKESLRLDNLSIQFNVLRREAETNRATYSQLLNRLNETSVTARLENTNLRLAEEAFIPGEPIEPNAKKINLMLAVLGIGIFVAYPIGLELLFNRVRGWSDVENYLKLHLLGEIPMFKKSKPEDRPLMISRSDDEEAIEAIRSFYAELKLSSRIDAPKTILITSTLPSEGKSFVASNLAGAFAAHGMKTLLLDTDLRRPVQHRAFNLDNDFGLLRWLNQKRPVAPNPLDDKDLGIKECAPNLYLLRTGGTTRRSTELLDPATIQGLLTALRTQFDIIIIDTPPAGVFPDALALSEHAAEIIYVVRYNHVSRPAVRRVIEHIARSGIEQSGIVLNMMPSGRGSAAYYSGYGHYGSKYYAEYAKSDKE